MAITWASKLILCSSALCEPRLLQASSVECVLRPVLFKKGAIMPMMSRFRSLHFAFVLAVAAVVVGTATAQVMKTPMVNKHLYSATADAKTDIAVALKQARVEHKRVILDFGGNWCGDCQVLDIYMHQSPNDELVSKHFIVVHIDIGRFDKNTDVAKKYDIPLNKGVPALAVLDAKGKLLYSQKAGEFEDMRNMSPKSLTDFLNRWKA